MEKELSKFYFSAKTKKAWFTSMSPVYTCCAYGLKMKMMMMKYGYIQENLYDKNDLFLII